MRFSPHQATTNRTTKANMASVRAAMDQVKGNMTAQRAATAKARGRYDGKGRVFGGA
jgi:hypothetical protein